MSRTKNLIQLISSTEKNEFDLVVKTYLREEYNFKKIIFTDGKDDIGIDIKVFDYKGRKIQYQLTTQKSKTQVEKRNFESKLYEDLKKAQKNKEEYNYSNKLIFFYSYELKNKKIREYEKIAFKEYGIDLELIEANRLAQEAENIIEIQKLLYKFSDIENFKISDNTFNDVKENLIFDVLSFGKPSEFKLQIIEAFILKALYTNKSLTREKIVLLCEEKFKVQENNIFYDKLLNKLLTSKKIRKSLDKTSYILASDEESILKTKVEQFELDKELFVRDITKMLTKYNQQQFLEEYILQLKELYTNNFNSELKELIKQEDNQAIFSVISNFLDFIKLKSDKNNEKDIAIKLLNYCNDSKFIQKIAASKVYIENINNSRLHNYLLTQKKVFIDTPIALYALCYYFKPKNNYNNYFYRISRNLIDFSRNEKIPLYISERYIWEVQNHIKEAFYLIPFSKIESFTKLGKSRNVFYNFYLYLENNNFFEDDYDFSDFLNEFRFSINASTKSINSTIEYYLEQQGINKYIFDKEYKIEETNKIFESKLLKNNKTKPPFVRNNDSIMVEFLADNDVDIHPLNPVFLTWDKTFYDVQVEYLKRYPNAQNWLMIPPGKLIDSYSILKFSIDNETVTENLLALLSDELISNTHSLLDTIKLILNPDNEISLEYTNKLADIREKEINQITSKISGHQVDIEEEAVIDKIFFKLTHYYQEKEDNQFELFKQIFTKKEYLNTVVDTITDAIDKFYTLNKIDDSLFKSFDKIIEKEKSA